MPALPNKITRRKGGTPVARASQDEIWERTLDALGLERMEAKRTRLGQVGVLDEDWVMDIPAEVPKAGKRTGFLDLPLETRRHIFKLSSTTELLALALVSKHFRDLAAERIYRRFHVVFPDDEDSSLEPPPFDGLAGGLDTFATSDYDYANYLREIIIDTLESGEKAERAYRHYLCDGSCGKFMNTLLLLTLRKARALEKFKWDIRVELNPKVFKALHNCTTLQHLHLRMHAGAPQLHAPRPTTASSHAKFHPKPNFTPPPPPPPPPPGTWNLSTPPPFPFSSTGNYFGVGNLAASKNHQRKMKTILPSASQTESIISGFKNLKTLSLVDLDTLDYVSEIQACIKNNSSTLHTLQLSFSEALANKSRKPPPEVHSDSESEDDSFSQLNPIPTGPALPPPLPPPGASDPSVSSKIVKAQEAKKEQEAVLARIFGLEIPTPPKPVPAKTSTNANVKSELSAKAKFSQELGRLVTRLMISVKPGHESSVDGKETLALIEKAARKFMGGQSASVDEASETQEASSVETTMTPASSTVDGSNDEAAAEADEKDQRGLFDEPETKNNLKTIDEGVANPEDINIEEPDVQELACEPDTPISDTQAESPSHTGDASRAKPQAPVDSTSAGSQPSGIDTTPRESAEPTQGAQDDADDAADQLMLKLQDFNLREFQAEGRRLKARLQQLRATMESGQMMDFHYQDLLNAESEFARFAVSLTLLTHDLAQAGDQIMDIKMNGSVSLIKAGAQSSKMRDYVRDTRGLTLQTLALYLIPIKASVLAKAVDLTVLRSITLLNVGSQVPFWNLLARENKISPLPLCKIFTDNVSLSFLAFAANLECIVELLLFERSNKPKVESTAARTTTTGEQIRRTVLKKHAHTLKVLMIRNDASDEWDMNAKTAMFLCQRAKNLEELAIGFGPRTMHTFLQFMPGLVSLRALHTTLFRSDDTCLWVMREFRKFTVDNISHHPEMKLEWLAVSTGVERLVRRKPIPPKKADVKGKGKARASGPNLGLVKMLMGASEGTVWNESSLGEAAAGVFGGVDSSDDEADYGLGPGATKGLRVETVESFRFWDVPGVRIFERDVVHGRL